jgi:hypothetical protein
MNNDELRPRIGIQGPLAGFLPTCVVNQSLDTIHDLQSGRCQIGVPALPIAITGGGKFKVESYCNTQ